MALMWHDCNVYLLDPVVWSLPPSAPSRLAWMRRQSSPSSSVCDKVHMVSSKVHSTLESSENRNTRCRQIGHQLFESLRNLARVSHSNDTYQISKQYLNSNTESRGFEIRRNLFLWLFYCIWRAPVFTTSHIRGWKQFPYSMEDFVLEIRWWGRVVVI